MAIFYYPDRTSPTTTLSLPGIEYSPSSRPIQKFQSRDLTPGGDAIIYDLGVRKFYISLDIRNLTSAQSGNLNTFIRTTVNWASETFDITVDDGNIYNSCRFWFDTLDTIQSIRNTFSTNLFIIAEV